MPLLRLTSLWWVLLMEGDWTVANIEEEAAQPTNPPLHRRPGGALWTRGCDEELRDSRSPSLFLLNHRCLSSLVTVSDPTYHGGNPALRPLPR